MSSQSLPEPSAVDDGSATTAAAPVPEDPAATGTALAEPAPARPAPACPAATAPDLDGSGITSGNAGAGVPAEPGGGPSTGLPGAAQDDADDSSSRMLPLLRRPARCDIPVPPARLRAVTAALLGNPRVQLDDAAARVVASGAVEPARLRAQVRSIDRGPDAGVDLLTDKTVTGGTLHVTGVHQRYVDDGILPDLRNGRWGHLMHPASDINGEAQPVTYQGLRVPDPAGSPGRPLAVLTVHLRDRAELAAKVHSSLINTLAAAGGAGGAPNDYTDSVLQQGVKEPVLLFVLRVVYADGTSEDFLMAGDGNSRLVSLWKARTGGDLDAAATAFVRNVLGEATSRPRDPRRVRASIAARAERVNRGLGEHTLTEQTIRDGQTMTVPAVVVVGVTSDDPAQPLDLVAAKDDLIASLHVHTTPWKPAARYDQGMQQVLRIAAERGIISDPAVIDVLAGRASVEEMAATLGLPPHPLWAAATWVERMSGTHSAEVRPLFRQVFGLAQAQRKAVGERLGVAALAPFRSGRDIDLDRALNAFSDGGPLTDDVLGRPWALSRGADPVAVLDAVRDAALAGSVSARCELVVLAGIAAMLDGLITRDRGSKEGTERDARHTPYRSTPYRLLEKLVATPGGIRTLHSLAVAFVRADNSLPKQFFADGSAVLDAMHAQVSVDYEWDLFALADPEATATALDRARSSAGGGSGGDTRPADVRLRQQLTDSLRGALRAAQGLADLAGRSGNTVMGTPDFVHDCRSRAEAVRDILIQWAPRSRVLAFDDDDEGTELDGSPFQSL